MIAAAARLLAEKALTLRCEALLAGIGLGSLAAWCAHDLAAAQGRTIPLVAEIGMADYRPRPCDPYVFNFRNLATCTHQTDAQTAIGLWTGGAHGRGLGALGAAQVDARGNFNSTSLADGTLLTGSGGSADVAAGAAEVVICLPAHPRRLVRELPYVTGTGERVTAVVTDRGIFEKPRGPHPLRLTHLVGPGAEDQESAVRELRARTGFDFALQGPLETAPPPAGDELERIRLYDPQRALLGPLPAAVPA
jgi:acyl CoA:acetate/3-ketoacid CoA transferase beta subunit